jgi:antitoxin ParD1/3/4
MTVNITPEAEQLLAGIFASGQYANEAEVLTVALRLLGQHESLRRDLEIGCQELDRGERLDADNVFSSLRQRAVELDRRGE